MEIVEIFSLLQGSEIGAMEPHPFLDEKTAHSEKGFSIAFRIAAVLVIGISIGLVSYYFTMLLDEHSLLRGSNVMREYLDEGKQGLVPRDSLMVSKQGFFADNFTISPNLENLVNVHSRSLSIQVLSPLNGEIIKERILFRWKVDTDDRLTLKILSNKETILQAISVRGSRYILVQKFPPGLYYWKLESKDELLYLGKFFVKQ
jgi:hypothetical protein